MTEILQMGGHAPYVWSAYGITLLVLIMNVWSARRRHVAALRRARESGEPDRPRKQPTVRQLP